MIQINGNAKEQYDGKTLEDVLAGEGYEKKPDCHGSKRRDHSQSKVWGSDFERR